MTNKEINELFGIKEGYEIVQALEKILMSKERREAVFDCFTLYGEDFSKDFLRDYYQQEHGDRDKLKQDYTPDSICSIVSGLAEGKVVADLCSGTGALTIAEWNRNKNASIHAYEYSRRAFLFCLFNMAIRNMKGECIQKDLLTGKFLDGYRLEKGERYSEITLIAEERANAFDLVVMNPPYSMQWDPDAMRSDKRFALGFPPRKAADLAFVETGLSMLSPCGTLVAILPHGVLFRGQSEEEIRANLVKENLIDAVIGLPDKLFMNTGIPVFLLVLKKNRKETNVLFIDASKKVIARPKQNIMGVDDIKAVLDTYRNRFEVAKLSHIASLSEIEKNEYNLNVPRYVDTFESEPVPDLLETVKEIRAIDEKEGKLWEELSAMLGELEASFPEENENKRFNDARAIVQGLGAKKRVNLFDICDVERMKEGKTYPAGTILVQLSASSNTEHPVYSPNEMQGDGKYAACVVKDGSNPKYIFLAMDREYPAFKAKYQTTINTQFDMLRFFGFEIHTDLVTQNRIALFVDVCDKIERVLCEGTEKRKDMKKYMLGNMFPA